MSIPGAGPEHDEHHHGHVRNHGAAISVGNVLISGGFFTINQVYSLLPVNSQQQVLDILCSPAGPSRIDGRLLHNSSEYEYIIMRGSQHTPDTAQEYFQQIFQENLPKRGAIRHGSSYLSRKGGSKCISIPIAECLACQGNLLATIILPDSKPPCTKYIVTTLAYQLVQNIPSTAEYMLASLRKDPGIFGRNTETQFREMFKIPLENAYMNASIAEKDNWPNTVVLDGNTQEFAPGSVADWILQSLSALPVNTITHIGEVRSQDRDLVPRPRSLAQRIQKFVLLVTNWSFIF